MSYEGSTSDGLSKRNLLLLYSCFTSYCPNEGVFFTSVGFSLCVRLLYWDGIWKPLERAYSGAWFWRLLLCTFFALEMQIISLKYFHIRVIWYICSRNNSIMGPIKVVHIHLIFEKKDFYFGSLSAVFDTLDEDRIGIKKSTLLHAKMEDGSVRMTKRARIVVSHLIRGTR